MEKTSDKPEKESQSDILIRLGEQAKFLCDEQEKPYAAVEIGGHTELLDMGKERFKDFLTREFFLETGKAPSLEAMNQALGTLKALAKFGGKKRRLKKRVAEWKGTIYYDLADKRWRSVRIAPDGCRILEKSPLLFLRNNNMKAQVEPDLANGDVMLLKKHLRLRRSEDWILCAVYIVTCLIPTIPHPVLIIAGEKGAAKSTTLRMLKSIIDPSTRDLLVMPNAKNELALTLSNSYMPCFDNLDSLSAEKSDLLCTASTGGSIGKRKLYSDDDEISLSFKHCVGMNGINVVATRPDLLDRSLILELKRIPEEERKEESVIWKEFNKDLPRIVGGAMTALSKAMSIFPTVKLDRLFRMADFTRWSFAVAEALDLGGENFLEAYQQNQSYANEEAIESHPVAAAIVAFTEKHSKWEGTVSDFLRRLERIAFKEKINTTSKLWPKASHVLSKRLKEIKSNLEQKGIRYSISHGGSAKIITIIKKDKDTETSD